MNIKKLFKKETPREQGRSMVEMLGVLAIIGVLSIGAVAGYSMAMSRHKANQILDVASKLSVVLQTATATDGWNTDLSLTDLYNELDVDGCEVLGRQLWCPEVTIQVDGDQEIYGILFNKSVMNALESITGRENSGGYILLTEE